ncbi:MAG: SUMF1/EgtB/PvdO family nonheme iron enzyme [Chloroflexi bacterium]|uniref:SUMF1/EgtB/PvdO family nonheme iron enzyme n=1 Tax=Candidatus Chlorohelix allophototropha TaxID=3003348 RepID=A0A8T7M9U1_9CHLR|nr:SUMF1/EgtB/PvdO family nonheme iron enzyme [Chloroflexota bacterium]WJW68743.1 SUMF1/EgtB/PvdO family nonheme iron enzyme [Chloroflexota bacterium L227-S17]
MPNVPPKLKVFLCHSSGDKEAVRALYQRLKAESWLHPWLDEEELLPGQTWRDEIEKAVEQSHIILVCLSPASIDKEGYVQREIKVALTYADYMSESRIFIIPLKLTECEIPRRLREWQWVNYYDERGHERLIKSLQARAEQVGVLNNNGKPVATSPVIKIAEPKPTTPESEREMMLREIADINTSHTRRQQIGDTRRGVGVREDGLPDIAWLPVAPGGTLIIKIQQGLFDIKDCNFEVQPFYIAQYQVTYAQYQAFVKAKDGYKNREWWQGFPKRYERQPLQEQRTKILSNPRDTISWFQAVAFGRWLNKRMQGWKFPNPGGAGNPLIIGNNMQMRLPTEWEWQWAAQAGEEKRQYPWGTWANTREANLRRTTAVGMYPQGAAVCGAMDMSGNVLEWCQNKYGKLEVLGVDVSGEDRTLRGGSCDNDRGRASCMYRSRGYPSGGGAYIGFRLVVSFPIAGL